MEGLQLGMAFRISVFHSLVIWDTRVSICCHLCGNTFVVAPFKKAMPYLFLK